MKKAVIVTAVVKTRIIVDENTNEEKIISMAKDRLEYNLHNDYNDLIDSIVEDTECPYDKETDVIPRTILIEDFFKVNGVNVVSRADYEYLSTPLCSIEFNDEQMNEIAKEIYNHMVTNYGKEMAELYLNGNDYDSNVEKEIDIEEFEAMVNDYWCTMENIALKYGMRYYEDMPIEEYYRLKNMQ